MKELSQKCVHEVRLPQFDGHLQLENVKESILWQESTTRWSIENRLSPW